MKITVDENLVNSDKFLDMPKTTQLLYFFYLIDADANGIIVHPQTVLKANGLGADDYKLLLQKGFIGADGGEVWITE